MQSSRKAFTLLELLIIILIAGAALAIFLPAVGRTHKCGNRQIKDSTQIRGIHQGFILVGNSNNDSYFVPSELDRANTTLASDSAKDDPGNVLSLLLFNGFFSPELTVSPAEQSPLIQVHQNYALSKPPAAAAGPNTWSGKWEKIDIQTAIDVLSKTQFDLDVVDQRYRDSVFTMPLPMRVTSDWKKLASHPQIKRLLTDEEAAHWVGFAL